MRFSLNWNQWPNSDWKSVVFHWFSVRITDCPARSESLISIQWECHWFRFWDYVRCEKFFKEFETFLWKKRRFRLRWDSSPGLSIALEYKICCSKGIYKFVCVHFLIRCIFLVLFSFKSRVSIYFFQRYISSAKRECRNENVFIKVEFKKSFD